jgi:periplasmic protein CpxP/Spy
MSKNRFYQIIIAALFMLNMVFVFLHINRPERATRPKEIIIERLQFDKTQIEQYENLVQNHHKLVLENEGKINNLKNNLYQQLNKPSDSLTVDSLTQKIAELEKRAELINYGHFQDIKKICTPKQLPLFENLVKELGQLFL